MISRHLTCNAEVHNMQSADSSYTNFSSASNHVYARDKAIIDHDTFASPQVFSQVGNQNSASDGLSATFIGLCCPICHRFFDSYDQMSRHLNIHNTGKPYVCSHCNASFNQAENLYVHISLYHTLCENQSNYSCCLCDKQFLRFTAYKSHLLLHQIDENFICSVCEQSFESVTLYEKHLHICTNTTNINKAPSQYRCRACGMLLSSVGKIKQHYRRRHPCYHSQSVENSAVITETNLEPSADINPRNIRSSKLRAAEYLSTIIKDSRRQSKNSLPIFDQLIYQISTEQPLIKDSSHTPKSKHKRQKAPYSCPVCHKKFIKPSLLKRHMTIHTKDKSYECALCHARFTQKSSAKTHILLHIGSLNPHSSYHPTESHLESSISLLPINNELQSNCTNKLSGLDSYVALPVNSGIQILTFPNCESTLDSTSFPHDSVVLQPCIPQHHASEGNLLEISTDHNLISTIPSSNLEVEYSCPQLFNCPVCCKTFQLSRSLAVHMLRHSAFGAKRYERLSNSRNLLPQKHVENKCTIKSYNKSKKSHSRKLLHRFSRCIHCFKVFRSINRLKLHIYKTHHGKCTIFMCHKCPRRFISNFGLKRHMNLRHRYVKSNIFCPICQKFFLSLSALKQHMDTHSSERLFSCYICHKRFQFLHSCRKHVLNHSITKRDKTLMYNTHKLSGPCTTDLVTIPKYSVLQTSVIDASSKSKDATSYSDFNVVNDLMNSVEKCSLYNNTELNTCRQDDISVLVHVESPPGNPRNIFVSQPKSNSDKTIFNFTAVNNLSDNITNFIDSEDINVATKPYSQFSQHQTCLRNDSLDESHSYCISNIPLNNAVNQTLDVLVIEASQTVNSTEVPIEGSIDVYRKPDVLATNNVDSSKFASNLNIDPLFNAQSLMPTVEPLEYNQINTNTYYTSSTHITADMSATISKPRGPKQVNAINSVSEATQLSDRTCLTETGASSVMDSNTVLKLSSKQLYGCGLCSLVCENAEILLQHNRLSHNSVSKSFSCSECPRSFTNPTLLLSHSRTHSSGYDGVLNCPLCPMTVFTKQSALSRHIIFCHPLPLSEPFMCSNCGMRFMMLRSLKSHVNNILSGVDTCVSKLAFEQRENNNDLQNVKNAKKVNVFNLNKNINASSLSSNLVGEIAKLQPSSHLSLSEKYLIKAARERVENTVSFPKARIDSHLLQNKSSISVSGNVCNICNAKFTKKSDLRYHLNVHFGIRPYECDKCHRRFMKHSQLRQHQFKVHELNIPKTVVTSKRKTVNKHALICHLCNSGFSSRSSLRLHVRLHTGTRSYGCPYCNSVFHNPSIRKRHLLKCKMKRQDRNQLIQSTNPPSDLNNEISSLHVTSINHIEEKSICKENRTCRSLKDCICTNDGSEHCSKCTLYLDILLFSEEMTNNNELNDQVIDVHNNINDSGCEQVNMPVVYLDITDQSINNNNNPVDADQPFVNQNISNTFDTTNGQQCQYLLDPTCDMTELNQHFIPVTSDLDYIHGSSNNPIPVVLYSNNNTFDIVPRTDICSSDALRNNSEYFNADFRNEPTNIIQQLNTVTTDNVIISSHTNDDENNLSTQSTKKSTIIKSKTSVYNKKFQRLFNCSTCHKTFTKNSSLTRHEMIHNMIKPFVCRFCGISFTQSSSLTSHELIHIGEKPYTCSQCNASFRQLCNLKRHLKLIHK
ncbi:Zinc finger protein 236 [Schistosoma japonicum]|nr:Zinc finger protein 236 [Schistosoma japonicum]KAH8851202.1 Zinc finger protein 236 [Schistosoma japonicum]